MKLCQIMKDGSPALGILTEAGVIDVAAEAALRGIWAPGTMLEAIEGGEAALEVLAGLADGAECFTDAPAAPAVTGGDKILCIGLNYMRHAEEFKSKIPAAPVIFAKFPNALAADGEAVKLCPDYKEYDYEAELVVVIGRKCKDVPADEALGYVFGYTCGDDFSTRDLQFTRGNQWILSKNFDGFAPMGPCVVTADSLDPSELQVCSRVNGELRQNGNTRDMIFPVAKLIEDISHHMTLMPGDVIFTGTPHGVMQGYPADQKNWLKPGDKVEIIIEGIGTLTNTLI